MQDNTKRHPAARLAGHHHTRRAAHCIAGRIWQSHNTYDTGDIGGGARLIASVRSSRPTFGAAAVGLALRVLGEKEQA